VTTANGAWTLQSEILAALAPLLIRHPLFAAKVYYLTTAADGKTKAVGVQCIANNEADLAELAAVVRDEAELSKLPHAEHLPVAYIGNTR
jgi:hypothetical protein